MGRRPIRIAKIDDRVSRNTTFTKRRQGLFGKAAQLCALSGTQLAIIVFSSAGTLFSMGHPSVDALVGNYIAETTPDPVDANYIRQVAELQAKIDELKRKIKEEKELKKQKSKVGRGEGPWWGKIKLEEFTLQEELQCLQKSLVTLRENVTKRMNELVAATVSGTEPLLPATVDIPTSPVTVIGSTGCEEPLPLCNDIDIPVIDNENNVDETLATGQEDLFWHLNETDDEIAAFLRDDAPLPLHDAYFTPSEFY